MVRRLKKPIKQSFWVRLKQFDDWEGAGWAALFFVIYVGGTVLALYASTPFPGESDSYT